MKATAHKITLFVLDTDGWGIDGIKHMLENQCKASPQVMEVKSQEIEDWDDDHLLNKIATFEETFNQMFKK